MDAWGRGGDSAASSSARNGAALQPTCKLEVGEVDRRRTHDHCTSASSFRQRNETNPVSIRIHAAACGASGPMELMPFATAQGEGVPVPPQGGH